METELWQTSEAQTYLNFFKSLEPHRFAVIKVGGELIEDDQQLALLANDLVKLSELGLYPTVVHGGGNQIDEGLKQAGIETKKVDGVRVTSAEAAALIPGILSAVNARLVAAINKNGIVAAGVTSGVFSATLANPADYGSTSHTTVAQTEAVERLARRRIIPVVSCAGSLAVANVVTAANVNADAAAIAAGAVIVPEKMIFLAKVGGVLDKQGKPYASLTPTMVDALTADRTIHSGMIPKVKLAFKLFGFGVHDIVITSPQSLLTELFTEGGAGTLIHHE